MQENSASQAPSLNTKSIIIGMLLVYILVHIGFYITYIKHFPEFDGFKWLHHIHGSLMGSWLLMLVLQPFLIHKQKFVAHRFIGKLSYIIAPAILVSMVLIARLNYHNGILHDSSIDVFARQSNTWMQIIMFTLFYSLAITYRKNTAWHMRFMIASAVVMTGPAMTRILGHTLDATSIPYAVIIALIVKTTIAGTLLTIDIVKKNNWRPYTIVLSAFLLADIAYIIRFSDVWQGFGKFIISTLY